MGNFHFFLYLWALSLSLNIYWHWPWLGVIVMGWVTAAPLSTAGSPMPNPTALSPKTAKCPKNSFHQEVPSHLIYSRFLHSNSQFVHKQDSSYTCLKKSQCHNTVHCASLAGDRLSAKWLAHCKQAELNTKGSAKQICFNSWPIDVSNRI